jgi:hypothetical protein
VDNNQNCLQVYPSSQQPVYVQPANQELDFNNPPKYVPANQELDFNNPPKYVPANYTY